MKDKIAMFCDVQPEAVIENRTASPSTKSR